MCIMQSQPAVGPVAAACGAAKVELVQAAFAQRGMPPSDSLAIARLFHGSGGLAESLVALAMPASRCVL
jgi:hypothetical protein